jgi:NDP-sugar pyrophosphorylase family protein
MNPNLVILAAGVASRMKKMPQSIVELDSKLLEDAQKKSKGMIRVGAGDRPFLDYVLHNAQKAGYTDVVFVVGNHDNSIREQYESTGTGHRFHGLRISFAVQTIPHGRTKPSGTADALLQALVARPDWKGQKLTVCNSDNLYSVNALRLIHESPHRNVLIDYEWKALRFEPERLQRFSVIKKDNSGYLVRIIEKPTQEELASVTDANGRIGVSMNIFRFSYDEILPVLLQVPFHPVRQEKELPEAVVMLVRSDPNSVMTIPLAEYVPDLTSPHDIAHVREYLKQNFKEDF